MYGFGIRFRFEGLGCLLEVLWVPASRVNSKVIPNLCGGATMQVFSHTSYTCMIHELVPGVSTFRNGPRDSQASFFF